MRIYPRPNAKEIEVINDLLDQIWDLDEETQECWPNKARHCWEVCWGDRDVDHVEITENLWAELKTLQYWEKDGTI